MKKTLHGKRYLRARKSVQIAREKKAQKKFIKGYKRLVKNMRMVCIAVARMSDIFIKAGQTIGQIVKDAGGQNDAR